MFRTSILASCLLIGSALEAQNIIPYNENSINPANTSCILALQGNKYFAETEDQMREYSKFYIAGLDHTMENLRLAQSLRDRLHDKSINPRTLHIPEFAELIDTHIAFIEEGIISQISADKTKRLELLERFKAEAQYRKVSEIVTYRWWFDFNLRLSLLATPDAVQLPTDDELESIYNRNRGEIDSLSSNGDHPVFKELNLLLPMFPERILIPTIHDLGTMSINKTYGTGVHLIGLRNNSSKAHKLPMSPAGFFFHDISHINWREFNLSPEFLFRFQQKLAGLSKRQRRVVERFYFELTHEFRFPLTKTDIGRHIVYELANSSNIFYSLTCIPMLRAVYGGRHFLRLISEVSQELGLLENE